MRDYRARPDVKEREKQRRLINEAKAERQAYLMKYKATPWGRLLARRRHAAHMLNKTWDTNLVAAHRWHRYLLRLEEAIDRLVIDGKCPAGAKAHLYSRNRDIYAIPKTRRAIA